MRWWMESASLKIEVDADLEMLESIHNFRSLRIQLARHQLNNASRTIDEMVRRGIIEGQEQNLYLEELKLELVQKIDRLERLTLVPNAFELEELELYLEEQKALSKEA
jgi:hypothetical protein